MAVCGVRAATSTLTKSRRFYERRFLFFSFFSYAVGWGATVVWKTAVNKTKGNRHLKQKKIEMNTNVAAAHEICSAFSYDSSHFAVATTATLLTVLADWLIDGIRYKLHLQYLRGLVNWSISCAVPMENGSTRDWGSATMWSHTFFFFLSFILSVLMFCVCIA